MGSATAGTAVAAAVAATSGLLGEATEVLGGERAQSGSQLLEQLGQQLSQEFGRGFEARNLRRMVKFAQAFPSAEIVSTLSTKLSWSHMVAIVALKKPQARQFYAQHAAKDRWSVRELTHQIERKAFERTELAALQALMRIKATQQHQGDQYQSDHESKGASKRSIKVKLGMLITRAR